MKPTPGRMVYYVPPQDCTGKTTLAFYPAIVTQINKDDTIELATFGPNSLYFQHNVPFADENTPGHWSWMPFQKDQQARLK